MGGISIKSSREPEYVLEIISEMADISNEPEVPMAAEEFPIKKTSVAPIQACNMMDDVLKYLFEFEQPSKSQNDVIDLWIAESSAMIRKDVDSEVKDLFSFSNFLQNTPRHSVVPRKSFNPPNIPGRLSFMVKSEKSEREKFLRSPRQSHYEAKITEDESSSNEVITVDKPKPKLDLGLDKEQTKSEESSSTLTTTTTDEQEEAEKVDTGGEISDLEDFSHCSSCNYWYYTPEKTSDEHLRLLQKYPNCTKLGELVNFSKACTKCNQSGKQGYTLESFITENEGWRRCKECDRWEFRPKGQKENALKKLSIDRKMYPFTFSFFAYYYPEEVDDRLLPFRRHILAQAASHLKSKLPREIFNQKYGDAYSDRRLLSIERKTKTRITLCKLDRKLVKGLPRRRIVIFGRQMDHIHSALCVMEDLMPEMMETAMFHRPLPTGSNRMWPSDRGLCVRRFQPYLSKFRPRSGLLHKPWDKWVLPHRVVPPILNHAKEYMPFRTSQLEATNTSNKAANLKKLQKVLKAPKRQSNVSCAKKPKVVPRPVMVWKHAQPQNPAEEKSIKASDAKSSVSLVSIVDDSKDDFYEIFFEPDASESQPQEVDQSPESYTCEKTLKFVASSKANRLFRRNGQGKPTSIILNNILRQFDCAVKCIEVCKERHNEKSFYAVVLKYNRNSDILNVCKTLGYSFRK